MRNVLIALFLIVLTINVAAKPLPPDPPKKEVKAKTVVEMIPTGLTNWGKLERTGGDWTLQGHEIWEAVADMKTRPDGTHFWLVIWTLNSNGQTAPGIYEIESDGILRGVWGYSGSCQIEGDKLTGMTSSDRIQRLEPAKIEPARCD